VSVRRFVPIAAAVLVASLAACSPSAGGSESDSKPSAAASADASTSAEASSSPAPGAPAGGNGLSLSEAIAKIPAADENRTGYKRVSFKHWIDEEGS